MQSAQPSSVGLNSDELELLTELLECEDKKLTIEIRHTDAAEFRHSLQRRLEMIGTILGKIRMPAEAK